MATIKTIEKLDCLFIHASADINYEGSCTMGMAMGVFALADSLKRRGYSVRIIHTGIEKVLDNNFSLIEYLKFREVRLIAISLHWYFQSANSMKLVEQIKSSYPHVKIVLGGFTASFFAQEIMRNFKHVDFVIQGDGEIPIVKLAENVFSSKPDFSSVPNLAWRDNHKVIRNEHSYVANEKQISKLNFSNFNLMNNFATYAKVSPELSEYSKEALCRFSTFFLFVGRGCPVNCSFCGGSRISQKIINGRDKVIFRSSGEVLKTIQDAAAAGIDCLYVCFDPDPQKKYYIELFSLLRKSKISISMVFECWSLPSRKFIAAFQKTFGKGQYSKLVLSPDTGSERLRRLNKGFFYTNKELVDTLIYLKGRNIRFDIYFGYPMPYENARDAELTYKFIKLLKQKTAGCGEVVIRNFGFDPASPMFLAPKKYNVARRIKHFSDYCDNKKIQAYLARTKGGASLRKSKHYSFRISHLLIKARWLFRLGCYKEAIEMGQMAKELIGDRPHYSLFYEKANTHLLLGLSYERSGQYKKALRYSLEAIALNPGSGAAHNNAAIAYYYQKKYDLAIRHCDKALQLGYAVSPQFIEYLRPHRNTDRP